MGIWDIYMGIWGCIYVYGVHIYRYTGIYVGMCGYIYVYVYGVYIYMYTGIYIGMCGYIYIASLKRSPSISSQKSSRGRFW